MRAQRCAPGPDEPVVILNGDVLSGHDLAAQLAAHRAASADVTLHLVEVDGRARIRVRADRRRWPGDSVSREVCPTRRPTRSTPAATSSSGPSSTRSRPVGWCPSSARRSPGCSSAGSVVLGYVETAYWLDLGTPAALVQGSADVVRGILSSPALPGPVGESLGPARRRRRGRRRRDRRHGGRCRRAGRVRAQSSTARSLQAGARVGVDAVVRRSVVGVASIVGPRTRVEDAVVGDGSIVGADNEIVASRVWADVVLPDKSVRVSSDA